MPPLEWYYAKQNKQHGPVSAAELKQLAARGELTPNDLVWCAKLDEWTPARKVGGLFDDETPAPPPKSAEPPKPSEPPAQPVSMPEEAPPKPSEPSGQSAEPSAKPVEPPPKVAGSWRKRVPPGATAPVFEKSEAAFERSRHGSGRHVFDRAIEIARTQLTMYFVELASRIFTLTGHYGLYLAMVALVAVSVLLGVKSNELNAILLGIAGAVILFVLQYTASRYFGALERLNRSTPARMCSAAFLDCYALLHMFGGLVILLGLTVLAIQTGPLTLVLPAIAAFILCQYVAVLALNPESLNLTITSEATAGEEAIGVLSFLVKLGLRLVPVAYGVGVAWGTITLFYAAFLVFMPPEGPRQIATFDGPESTAAMNQREGPDVDEGATSDAAPAIAEEGASVDEPAMGLLAASVTASRAAATLIAFAVLPFVTYVLFLVFYLVIDVLRAVLAISHRLDEGIED